MKSVSIKKMLVALFSFAAIFALFVITASAEDYGNFSYSLVEPEGDEDFESYNEITSYSADDESEETVVEIPSEIEDVAVTTICASAFSWNETITEFIIPDTVTTIENGAFYHCSSLKVVVIPDSVTFIGDSAFQDCTSLEYVIIGDSVIKIGDIAFKGCSSLTTVNIGSSVETIGNGVFFDCSALSDVFVPSSVTEIGSFAFGFVQNGDVEDVVDGFTFYTDTTVASVDDYIVKSSDELLSTVVTVCSEDAHSLEWTLAREATDAYVGLEVAQCSVCKNVFTQDNTDIAEAQKDNSALITLIVGIILVVIVVIWILVYINKSKKMRAKAIEDYKAGRPFDTEDERKADEAKIAAKKAKKRAKQETRQKKEEELQR